MRVETNWTIRNNSLNLLYCRFFHQLAPIVPCLPFHILFFSFIIVQPNETNLGGIIPWMMRFTLEFVPTQGGVSWKGRHNCKIKKKNLGHFFSRNSKEMIWSIFFIWKRKILKHFFSRTNKEKIGSSIVMWIKKNQACTNESHSVYENKVIGGRPKIRINFEYGICCKSSSLEPAMEMQLYLF